MNKISRKIMALVSATIMLSSTFMFAHSANAEELLKVPVVDTANVGYNITRTMNLLETSTAEHPNTVKIAYYGQSLIDPNNKWPTMLTEYLQEKYPTANVIMNNLGVGGFTASYLKKMVRDDMAEFYPDLVIYMDYGEYQDYSEILRYIRTYTTSEFMFIDDHFTGGEVDPANLPKASINVSTTIPNLCKEFNCELADTSKYFIQYCADNKVSSSTYLNDDNTHMNALGQELMFNIIKQYFVYKTPAEADAFKNQTVKTLEVGKDIKWENGELKITEDGNRFEAVMGEESDVNADVTVNGVKPSEMLELYLHSRIYGPGGYWDIGGFLDAAINKIPQEQDWTIQLTKVDGATGAYSFDLTGSKTGADGSGSSEGIFTSNSGILSIDPEDAFTAGGTYSNTDGATTTGFYKVGNKFEFKTFLNATDTVSGKSGNDKTILIASGLKGVKNTVILKSQDSAKTPNIKKIIVYRPKLTTEKTDKPKKLTFVDNSKYVEGIGKKNGVAYLKIGDRTWEKVVDPSVGDFAFELNKKYPAGTKAEIYVDYFNEASETVVIKCKPRKPTVKKVTVKSKAIEGKASAKATVSVKVGTKKLTAKANAKGVYKVKLAKNIRKKLKAGLKITVVAKVNKISSAKKTIKVKKK